MKLILKISLACLLATGCASKISAQTYVKLNGLYALVGVVNPAVEFTISPKSTFQTEIVVSPWESVNNHHALFCIFMGEYRRYFKEHNRGWYLGANIGMQAFDLSKPYIENWKLKFENRYSKGYGFMIGLCVGYAHLPRTLGARRLLRLVVDEQLLQRLFHGRENRHEPRPSGRTQIPRSVQRFVGVVSQQDRRLDRVSYLHAPQQTADSGRALNSSCGLR